ncbi:hypothetical protein K3M67_17445 (plasmid) [Sphingobium sp. V4]|uniref:hypothetical protein n=1 Tax=Sphingobium sp. V4 TaxID=3038927 RepID=UPI002557EB17|nr:hypothetical protein [Sphingobium sp. V4]WIW90843.1 hypothetical protein K3M67_17445 [Sphingobium sp. V4]
MSAAPVTAGRSVLPAWAQSPLTGISEALLSPDGKARWSQPSGPQRTHGVTVGVDY